MDLQFIGSGDAFGSGGRFNTCFLVTAAGCRFLIDCGATSLVALRRLGVDPNTIDGVVLSHLHGDHFGGLPFLLLDARHVSKRRAPLFILGPAGVADRLQAAHEDLFPGSWARDNLFELEIGAMQAGERTIGRGFAVTPYPAEHSTDTPCFALRIECDGKVIAYSGDTGWTETLVPAARDADLFICECSSYDRPVAGHLDYLSLCTKLPTIGAKRVILTHMGADMLDRRDRLGHATASDGLIVSL